MVVASRKPGLARIRHRERAGIKDMFGFRDVQFAIGMLRLTKLFLMFISTAAEARLVGLTAERILAP